MTVEKLPTLAILSGGKHVLRPSANPFVVALPRLDAVTYGLHWGLRSTGAEPAGGESARGGPITCALRPWRAIRFSDKSRRESYRGRKR